MRVEKEKMGGKPSVAEKVLPSLAAFNCILLISTTFKIVSRSHKRRRNERRANTERNSERAAQGARQ